MAFKKSQKAWNKVIRVLKKPDDVLCLIAVCVTLWLVVLLIMAAEWQTAFSIFSQQENIPKP